ncbi:putative T7SS-secreted protein [Streptomyces lunalinharesii]|uniref:tRNA nuclease CdiA C-terminal domain-containing protein n=1 Tax=Streptomyces lunalinharesii TaxID=333384 RepID=A0ABN3SXF4_9ACTN
MTDLEKGSRATQLIPGNPAALRRTQSALQAYGDLLYRAGEGLKRIDTSDGWSGEAADAFHEVYHGQPSKWLRAGDAFHDAAKAMDAYVATLSWAQNQAEDAISLWNSGEENHEAAQSKLDSAASQLDTAGQTAAIIIGEARDLAPPEPGFWSELGDGIGSFLSGTGHVVAKVGETVLTDLASVGNAMLHDPGAVGQVLGGIGLATLGAGGEVAGAALDLTGVGAALGVPTAAVSATAIAGGLGLAGAGASDIFKDAAGPNRVNMESDGRGGGGRPPEDNGHTLPQRDPDPNATARGNPESISKNADPTTVRALTRQNESADKLAQHGYDVEHSPEVPGSKNPDYKINGKVFDCYSPSSGSARNIAGEIQGKIDKEQTERVVLNLTDSPVDVSKMNAQLHDWPNPGLKEVIAIDKDGNILHLYP